MRSTCLPSKASRLRVSIPGGEEREGEGVDWPRPTRILIVRPRHPQGSQVTLPRAWAEGANLRWRGVSDGVLQIHLLRNSRVFTYIPRIRHIGRVYLRFT